MLQSNPIVIALRILLITFALSQNPILQGADFFQIQSVKYLSKPAKDEIGVWGIQNVAGHMLPAEFRPNLEVTVTTAENARADQTIAKAYFFDDKDTIVKTLDLPSKSGKRLDRLQVELPVLFYKNQPSRFFFEVPPELKDKPWKAVLVFGDKNEARSACYPVSMSDFLLKYPEKDLVHRAAGTSVKIERKPAMDPLVERVMKTGTPKMPQITLFLRPPKGITSASEVQGVMAICILDSSVDSMRIQLRKEEMEGDYNGLFQFANDHKLAILAWGSRRLWDPEKNYDDLGSTEYKEIDDTFNKVADAWERSVKDLSATYGLPDHNFLLWGQCGTAQWAHRLCLRKPGYFLAINIHNSGSFDAPTWEARKVLWCVTTGELYGGYGRSKRFVSECAKFGYPMVYKAIEGLAHSANPVSKDLGFKFFELALQLQKEREEFDRKNSSMRAANSPTEKAPFRPWPEIFQHPPFYGDMVNQNVYPANEIDQIPSAFRVSIPNDDLAKIWVRRK